MSDKGVREQVLVPRAHRYDKCYSRLAPTLAVRSPILSLLGCENTQRYLEQEVLQFDVTTLLMAGMRVASLWTAVSFKLVHLIEACLCDTGCSRGSRCRIKRRLKRIDGTTTI